MNEATGIVSEFSATTPYPVTKIHWMPSDEPNVPFMFASSSDALRLYVVGEGENKYNFELVCDLKNQEPYNFPLTSFDWNRKDY